MTVRQLDSNGDIVTSGQHFISRENEIAQLIKQRLGLFVGEYFRDISEGLPWFEAILGKESAPDQRDSIIKRRIVQTNGVNQITRYESDFNINQRTYTINCTVLTEFGLIQLEI